MKTKAQFLEEASQFEFTKSSKLLCGLGFKVSDLPYDSLCAEVGSDEEVYLVLPAPYIVLNDESYNKCVVGFTSKRIIIVGTHDMSGASRLFLQKMIKPNMHSFGWEKEYIAIAKNKNQIGIRFNRSDTIRFDCYAAETNLAVGKVLDKVLDIYKGSK